MIAGRSFSCFSFQKTNVTNWILIAFVIYTKMRNSSNPTWKPTATRISIPMTSVTNREKFACVVGASVTPQLFQAVLCPSSFGDIPFLGRFLSDPSTYVRHCFFDYGIGRYPFATQATYFQSFCDQCYRAMAFYNCKALKLTIMLELKLKYP